MSPRFALLLVALIALAACRQATSLTNDAPRQLHIAGSSAAYPFATAAAERFVREDPEAIAPLTQADGSGSGIARLCARPAPDRPDIVGVTRAMTGSERTVCARNHIGPITVIRFGWSALVFATRPDAPPLFLSRDDLRRALIGTASLWRAIDPRLPDLPIRIDGPSQRSAFSDGLFDILLAPACIDKGCVRGDGGYRGHGASAPLALAAALVTPGALAMVPWSYAAERGNGLRLVAIDGVTPGTDTIAAGRYPLRLPLMLMFRTQDARSHRDLRRLITLFADGWTSGDFERRGLVPLDAGGRSVAARQVAALTHP